MDSRAESLIECLGLAPHPEGGYFKEIFRLAASVLPDDERPRRAAVTTIYYMLVAGQHSRWHRVASDEIWHFYDGSALDLFSAPSGFDRIDRVRLGPGESWVFTVPSNWWQAAVPTGPYALAGCTVAPGFDYEDFSLLADDVNRDWILARLDSGMRALA